MKTVKRTKPPILLLARICNKMEQTNEVALFHRDHIKKISTAERGDVFRQVPTPCEQNTDQDGHSYAAHFYVVSCYEIRPFLFRNKITFKGNTDAVLEASKEVGKALKCGDGAEK